jgi:hypothetical protein
VLFRSAYVVSRARLSWTIRPCCEDRPFSGTARAFFLDEFVMTRNGGIVGGGRNTPPLTDGTFALYFNPLNTSAAELRRCQSGGVGDVTGPTEGTISLDWNARLLQGGEGVKEGFSDAGMRGDIRTGPAPFGVESNHKLFFLPENPEDGSGPEAWTMHPVRTVGYAMSFRWDNCGARKRRFSPAPVLPAGAQRNLPDRGPAPGAEVYREALNLGF